MNPAEAYILNHPEPRRSLLLHLSGIIAQQVPEADLRYRYGIPFYYLRGKPFCYLNATKGYVDLGFPRGYALTRHRERMVTDGRKRVSSLRYSKTADLDLSCLSEVLAEARALYPG